MHDTPPVKRAEFTRSENHMGYLQERNILSSRSLKRADC